MPALYPNVGGGEQSRPGRARRRAVGRANYLPFSSASRYASSAAVPGLRRLSRSVAQSVATHRAPSIIVALVDFAAAIAKRVVAWQERRTAERELRRLDDRMLRDIGIMRADIPQVAAGRPVSAKAEEANDALDALRRWARSRAAAKDLNTLDSRMLNDIGMVRGDIDWVAEELALRSLHPANTNNASRVA